MSLTSKGGAANEIFKHGEAVSIKCARVATELHILKKVVQSNRNILPGASLTLRTIADAERALLTAAEDFESKLLEFEKRMNL